MSVDDRLQPLLAEISRLRERQREPLPSGGRGGTSGGVTDDWKESVDRQLGQLHDDFRRLVGLLIAAVAAPLLAVIGLYVYTGTKFDAVEARFERLDTRLGAIEMQQARMEQHLADKLDALDSKRALAARRP